MRWRFLIISPVHNFYLIPLHQIRLGTVPASKPLTGPFLVIFYGIRHSKKSDGFFSCSFWSNSAEPSFSLSDSGVYLISIVFKKKFPLPEGHFRDYDNTVISDLSQRKRSQNGSSELHSSADAFPVIVRVLINLWEKKKGWISECNSRCINCCLHGCREFNNTLGGCCCRMFQQDAVFVDIDGKLGRGSVKFLDGYHNRTVGS